MFEDIVCANCGCRAYSIEIVGYIQDEYMQESTKEFIVKYICRNCGYSWVDNPFNKNTKEEKMKIKYALIRNGRSIAFTIYEMDERFRASNEVTHSFTTKNGVKIVSCENPDLSYPSYIYLRGADSSADEDIVVLTRSTKEETEKFVKTVHEALKEWSENWEGFKDKKDNKSCIVEL